MQMQGRKVSSSRQKREGVSIEGCFGRTTYPVLQIRVIRLELDIVDEIVKDQEFLPTLGQYEHQSYIPASNESDHHKLEIGQCS